MDTRIRKFELKTLKEISFVPRLSTVIPIEDGGFLVQYRDSAILSRFDSHFNLLWQKDIGRSRKKFGTFTLTVSPDGNFIAVHGNSTVRIMDKGGYLLHSREHKPWESYLSNLRQGRMNATYWKSNFWVKKLSSVNSSGC